MVALPFPIPKNFSFLQPLQRWIRNRSEKPKTVDVEIIGPNPIQEKWEIERAERELPIQARFIVPQKLNKSKLMYCVFKAGEKFYPVPLDRKQAILSDEPEDYLEKVTANTQQIFHMEKQSVRRKRYTRKGSAMQKAQATMYVVLAGGLGFLLFIIFSEVTNKQP